MSENLNSTAATGAASASVSAASVASGSVADTHELEARWITFLDDGEELFVLKVASKLFG